MLPKVLIITGPTASGKSKIAMEKALELNGEIINADSRQIYEDLIVGTASPSDADKKKVKHYMYNFLPLNERYSSYQFVLDAQVAIKQVIKNKKHPIITGGTGLYLDSLIFGYKSAPTDQKVREELEKRSTESLYDELVKKDPDYADTINYNARYYIIRALEVIEITGMTRTEIMAEKSEAFFEFEIIYHTLPREEIIARIESRTDKIWEAWVQEVRGLTDKYADWTFPGFSSLGYIEMRKYLMGFLTERETKNIINIKTRQYAKRQETWFRRPKFLNMLEKSFLPIPENSHKTDKVQEY